MGNPGVEPGLFANSQQLQRDLSHKCSTGFARGAFSRRSPDMFTLVKAGTNRYHVFTPTLDHMVLKAETGWTARPTASNFLNDISAAPVGRAGPRLDVPLASLFR